MPNLSPAMICLLHDVNDGTSATALREKLEVGYPFLKVILIGADTPESRALVQSADLVLVHLRSQEPRIPVFDQAWAEEIQAHGGPPRIFVHSHTRPSSAPEPFGNGPVLTWDGESVEEIKHHLGTVLGVVNGLVYVAFGGRDGREMALQLAEALRARHYQVFCDIDPCSDEKLSTTRGLRAGFAGVMDKAIALIVVDTPGALDTRQVKEEVRLACERQLLVKPLVWRPWTERDAKPMSRLFEEEWPHANLVLSDTIEPLSDEQLAAFLDSFEAALIYDMEQRNGTQRDAREMFAYVSHTFTEKDPLRRLFESRHFTSPPTDVAHVLSNASVRSLRETATLKAYAESLIETGLVNVYPYRYYLHSEFLDNSAKRASIDQLSSASCDLVFVPAIPLRPELHY